MSAIPPATQTVPPDSELILGAMPRGFVGHICEVRPPAATGALPPAEMERRLIELGFVEGARVEILHQGPLGDPIAVRVNEATVALRRRDAAGIRVVPGIAADAWTAAAE